jgi:UDP-N-acetylmuramate dehydrogenase
MMNIVPNVSLANYSTMRLGGIADFLVEIHDQDELKEAYDWATAKQLPVIMIGGGSNIFWQDAGFHGLVMVNKIMGYEDHAEDTENHYLTIGAGENWDSVVARTVAAGLTGIEALSLIPGSAGATPVQNVGAYGQDISQTLVSVEVFDCQTGQLATLPNDACGFGYRTSKFKGEFRGRYFITSITLHLMVGNPLPPYYGAVQAYLEANPTDQAGRPDGQPAQPITPAVIRDAVIAIRSAKLPDVERVANNGSFFANPIVSEDALVTLRTSNPSLPYWPLDGGGAKIPAAWLIEQAGFKDYHDADTGMATWPKQPLVLINETAKTTSQLLAFRDKITAAVHDKFGISLTQEPELLP